MSNRAEFEIGADARPFVDAMRQMDRAFENTKRKINSGGGLTGGTAFNATLATQERRMFQFYNNVARAAEQSSQRRVAAERRAMGTGARGGGGFMAGLGGFGMAARFAPAAMAFVAGREIIQGMKDNQDYIRATAAMDKPLSKLGISRDAMDAQIGDLEKRTGVDDSEIAGMYSKTFNAGETSLENATKKIRLAMDIQAAGFADADSVLDAFNKGGAENTMMLKKLSQSMGLAVNATDSMDDVVGKMNTAVAGTAEHVQKAGGAMAEFAVEWDNLRQKLGEKAAEIINPVIGAANKAMSASPIAAMTIQNNYMKKMRDITMEGDFLTKQRGGTLPLEDSKRLATQRKAAADERARLLLQYNYAMTPQGLRMVDPQAAAVNDAPTVSPNSRHKDSPEKLRVMEQIRMQNTLPHLADPPQRATNLVLTVRSSAGTRATIGGRP